MNQVEQMKACEEFLAELGKGLPIDERVMAGYAAEATVQVDKSGKKLNAGWWPVPYAPGKYINAAANCYVCISSSIKTPNPRTGEMRYWRGENSFGHGLALMVDDIGDGKGSKGGLTVASMAAQLEPTAVIETSPGNHQLFYFLEEPEPSMAKFKAFLTAFVTNVLKAGGDNTIRDVSRYGRMPIGINNKRHSEDNSLKYSTLDGRGKAVPFQVRLVSADYSRRYSIERIASAFKFEVILPIKRVVDVDERELAADAYWLRQAVKLMAGLGEGSGGMVNENMSGKMRIMCPWGGEHTNGDPSGAYFRGPIPGADVDFVFGCAHDTCRKTNKRTWAAFVDQVVMPKIVDDLESANENDIYWPRCKGVAAKRKD
jgi:RepB DNA-primase from phage plasmid